MIDLDNEQIDALLKRLHLANTRRLWPELVRRAEQEDWSHRDFLVRLLSEEIAHRQQTRLARVTRRAKFPFLKTVEDFDFTFQSTLRMSLLGSDLSADFVTDGRGLILSGKPGRGKTHLAVAIAYRAILHGFDALFVTAAELIETLSNAARRGTLREELARYVAPHVLVVDEVGYLTYSNDAANVLYHVVNARHLKRKAMIFTTNKAAGRLGLPSCTTPTSPTPSSTASSSAAGCSSSTAPRAGRPTSTAICYSHDRTEFLESTDQNFRNPQCTATDTPPTTCTTPPTSVSCAGRTCYAPCTALSATWDGRPPRGAWVDFLALRRELAGGRTWDRELLAEALATVRVEGEVEA